MLARDGPHSSTGYRKTQIGEFEVEGSTNAALLREPEARDYLTISRTKFRELMARGDITPLRIGRSVRFSRKSLDQFIERLQREGAIV